MSPPSLRSAAQHIVHVLQQSSNEITFPQAPVLCFSLCSMMAASRISLRIIKSPSNSCSVIPSNVNPRRLMASRTQAPLRSVPWLPIVLNDPRIVAAQSKAYSNVSTVSETILDPTITPKVGEPKPNIPLKTYNVTKADARPKISEHHKIQFDDKKILVPWEEGKTSHFQHLWIRDHCQCSECFHPDTKQRLVNTFDIPRDVKPASVEGMEVGMEIIWKNGHKSFFSWEWLHLHSYNPRLERYLSPQFKLWGPEIGDHPPEIKYGYVMDSDTGVAEWTRKIRTYGFCYVDGVPISLEATKELVERIAHIRHTHYGGFWDFTSDLSMKDAAYTNLPLNVHTDTTYFSEPVGLQMLHLLEHTSGSGGQTVLVDGFRAAKILRDEDPIAYRILSNVRIPTHSSGNEGISIQPYASFPILNHHPVNGELVQVRWNNDDRATMDRWNDAEEVDQFYDAIRSWHDIIKRRESEYWEQLIPGRVLIFDNWRVLHGRAAFDGKRRLCGAYISRDDFASRFLMTNSKKEDVLRAL